MTDASSATPDDPQPRPRVRVRLPKPTPESSSPTPKPAHKKARLLGETRVRKPHLLELQPLGGGEFQLIAPREVLEREDDLFDVRDAIAHGELELAQDELLYLVSDCREFLEAYNLLAEVALEKGDIPLARGYFGFAFETGSKSLPRDFRGLLPHPLGYNEHFFAAGRGLARCLIALKEVRTGQEVLELLAKYDPTEADTLSLLDQLRNPKQDPS